MVNIVSQTLMQENTPEQLRGRVFSVQFMLNNLVGIPPMLAIAALADLIGIPQTLLGISGIILVVLGITLRLQRQAKPAGSMQVSSGPSVELTPNAPDKTAAAEPKSDDPSPARWPILMISDS
jgi:hypothetical protein